MVEVNGLKKLKTKDKKEEKLVILFFFSIYFAILCNYTECV